MDVVFFFIRLPFFLVGVFFLLLIGMLILCVAIGLAPLVLPLVAAVWLFVLLPLNIIHAAFTNRADELTSFFEKTGEWIVDVLKQTINGIGDYFNSYVGMFRWLIGSNKLSI